VSSVETFLDLGNPDKCFGVKIPSAVRRAGSLLDLSGGLDSGNYGGDEWIGEDEAEGSLGQAPDLPPYKESEPIHFGKPF
jgi:hypothetical protein